MTDSQNDEFTRLFEKLKQSRDELNVQMHLAKAEAKELWQETEEKWRHLRTELDRVNQESSDTSKDVGAAAMLAAEEVRRAYDRLRKLL